MGSIGVLMIALPAAAGVDRCDGMRDNEELLHYNVLEVERETGPVEHWCARLRSRRRRAGSAGAYGRRTPRNRRDESVVPYWTDPAIYTGCWGQMVAVFVSWAHAGTADCFSPRSLSVFGNIRHCRTKGRLLVGLLKKDLPK